MKRLSRVSFALAFCLVPSVLAQSPSPPPSVVTFDSKQFGMDVDVYARFDPNLSRITPPAEQPIVVFVKELMPLLGIAGYQTLLYQLAAQGITVIAPIYKPDYRYGFLSDGLGSINAKDSGYHSAGTAKAIRSTLKKIEKLWNLQSRSWVLYGHSIGARVALQLLQAWPDRFEAALLDAPAPRFIFAPNKKGQIVHKFPDLDPLCGTPAILPMVSLVQYADDAIGSNAIQDFQACLEASPHQTLMIRGFTREDGTIVDAGRFAPFSNYGPPSGEHKGTVQERDEAVQSLFKTDPFFEWNEVDEYSTLAIIPALAWSAMSGPTSDVARDVLYGDSFRLAQNGQIVREVVAQTFP